MNRHRAFDKNRILGNDNKENADFFYPEELIRKTFRGHTKHLHCTKLLFIRISHMLEHPWPNSYYQSD